MSWIQIQSNLITIEANGLIKYTPEDKQMDPQDVNIHAKDHHTVYTGLIQSSDFFENGKITFSFLVREKSAFLNLQLFSKQLFFSVNSNTAKSLFSIRRESASSKGIEVIAQTGNKNSIILNHEYHVRIEASGSTIKVFLDGVLLFNQNVVVSKSQIKLGLRSYDEIIIKDFKISSRKPKVFVVMQFSDEYDQLYSQVIKPVCESFGYECLRGDEYFTNGSILKDITDAILDSAIIIADITPNNANVFYEVGYSHALNKPTILLSDKKKEKLPFDVSGFRTLFYDNTIAGKSDVEHRLKKHLENIQSN